MSLSKLFIYHHGGSRPTKEKPVLPVSDHLSAASKTPASNPYVGSRHAVIFADVSMALGSKGKRCQSTVLLRSLRVHAGVLRHAQEA